MSKSINKDIVQSYLLTSARYDFNVEEKRVLYRLVEMCQNQLEGKKLNSKIQMDKNLVGDYICILPITSFLADNDSKNHYRVKDALRRLRNKTIEIEDEEEWKLIGIIEKPKFEKRGYVKFEIQPEIFEAILNFAKGYRKIELKTAFEFDSVYGMRMYELLSGKKDSITYSIDELKKMFKVENKYKYTKDFILRVIDRAKIELDQKSPYGFNYQKNTEGKKIVSLTFTPYSIPGNVDYDLEKQRLQKQVSIWWDVDKKVADYLQQNYQFTTAEIRNNRELIIQAQKEIDLLLFLSKKRRISHEKINPKGYVISALKKHLQTITHE